MNSGVSGIAQLLVRLRNLLRARGRTVHDSDDLIQEAFLRLELYCRKRTVREPEAFLVRTVLNLSTDEHRSAHSRYVVSGRIDSSAFIDPAPPPDEALDGQQRLHRMAAGLRYLSPRVREVFLMNRLDGYTYTQIASQLGISESAVEKYIAKASQHMWEWMNRGSSS